MSKIDKPARRDTFANGPEGRVRRDMRRNARAAKRAWLEM